MPLVKHAPCCTTSLNPRIARRYKTPYFFNVIMPNENARTGMSNRGHESITYIVDRARQYACVVDAPLITCGVAIHIPSSHGGESRR